MNINRELFIPGTLSGNPFVAHDVYTWFSDAAARRYTNADS